MLVAKDVVMSTTPQPNPTADDLAREQYYATLAATTPPPATYKGHARGKTKDSSWRTNIALWETYPGLPVAPLAAGDKAGAAAWLRIEAMVVQRMFQEKPGSQAANWNPSKPTWPLPTPPASWAVGSKFGARRPWKKDVPQTRNHTGVDLDASPGTPVIAPESGKVIAPNTGWEYNKETGKGVKALIMQTDSGLTILLGGIRPDSAVVKAGQKVAAGDKLAEIGRYPLGDSMLHFTLHDALLSEKEVNARKSWPYGQPPPANVIDPAGYLGAAANNPKYSTVGFIQGDNGPGLVPNDVEGGELFEGTEETTPFVSASDGRTGTKPCVGKECVQADAIAWYDALASYYSAAYKLHEYAAYLPNPTKAVAAASVVLNDAGAFLTQTPSPSAPGTKPKTTWADAAQDYLSLTYEVREAIDTLTAFVASASAASASAPGNEKAPDAPTLPPANPPPPVKPVAGGGGGGGLGIIAGLVGLAVVAGIVIAATSKSSRAKAAVILLLTALPWGGCGPQPPPTDLPSSSSGTASDTSTSSSPTSSTSANPPSMTTSGVPSGAEGSGEPATQTSSSGTSGASSTTGGSESTGEPPPPSDGCSCNSDRDCPVGTCGTFGLCVTACDPGCPVACQLGAPNMCDPPCNVPCPSICSAAGECTVCIPAPVTGGDSAPHMTEPTSG